MTKRFRKMKYIAALLFSCVLFLQYGAGSAARAAQSTYAADRQLDPAEFEKYKEDSSITIKAIDPGSEAPVRGGRYAVYQITDIRLSEDLVITQNFSQQIAALTEDGRLSLNQAPTSVSFDADHIAEADSGILLAYLTEKGVNPLAEQEAEEGSTTFAGLHTGIYLVAQTSPADGYSSEKPFLVSVPEWQKDPGSPGEGRWNFDRICIPKNQAQALQIAFHASKILKISGSSGAPLPDLDYTFILKGENSQTPMPDGNENGQAAIKVKAGQTGQFGAISYKDPGEKGAIYNYTLAEQNDGIYGITYDPAVYGIKVDLGRTREDSKLTADVTITRTDRSNTNSETRAIWQGTVSENSIVNAVPTENETAPLVAFTNTYTPSTETETEPETEGPPKDNPPESETNPPQSETTPPQSETTPPQSETTPPQSETQPPQSETQPSQSETNPPHSPGNPPAIPPSGTPGSGTPGHSTSVPQTGDDTPIMLYMILIIVSFAAGMAAYIRKKHE